MVEFFSTSFVYSILFALTKIVDDTISSNVTTIKDSCFFFILLNIVTNIQTNPLKSF